MLKTTTIHPLVSPSVLGVAEVERFVRTVARLRRHGASPRDAAGQALRRLRGAGRITDSVSVTCPARLERGGG
jgi:hypothetical protein